MNVPITQIDGTKMYAVMTSTGVRTNFWPMRSLTLLNKSRAAVETNSVWCEEQRSLVSDIYNIAKASNLPHRENCKYSMVGKKVVTRIYSSPTNTTPST
jgi:hypothetical protein